MNNKPLSDSEPRMIEQVRKVNKLLSLYVLAIQERKPLTADEHGGLARALRSVAEVIEQDGQRTAGQLPTNTGPLNEGSLGAGPPPDSTTVEP